MERRLTAILAADVVGYSQRIGTDEAGTIRAVQAMQADVLDPAFVAHGGRLFKTMGDGFLTEFASVVAAIEAAAEIQRIMAERADLQLRIGVHVGDVAFRDEDLLGDGVNIAARIEGLARPGGIGISEDAHRQVRDKLTLDWTDGGEQPLKNIARPIRIWHWHPTGAALAPAADPLPLPDIPSVAILPFDNMSGDPEQDFFADGMTEDLTTDLSKVSGIFVVARTSTFRFKGQQKDIRAIAAELGVRHILEGSVRKAGNRVRISAQLIEAESGGHVWAERYDGMLDNVFELQDEVCSKVVSAMSVRLTQSEALVVARVHTRNVDAYELFVQAKATPYPPIPARIQAARGLFERVIDMDPEFAGGYAGLSWMIGFGAIWGHQDGAALGRKAEALARRAIEADEQFGWSYLALAISLAAQSRMPESLAASRKCRELLPNDADAHAFLAMLLSVDGQFEEASATIDRAIRLNPLFINGPYLNVKSQILCLSGDFRASIRAFDANVAQGGPVGPPAYCWSTAAHAGAGQDEEAARITAELRERFPDFRLDGWHFLSILTSGALREQFKTLLLAAGVPA